ncbi:MAG: hypothetical protein H6741_10335 [Alphaproteobacteria bacterium]|nr:hypothetical protein [Alphaproteobacteria bacterium]MCB9793112.1 hypothetical protein [Alphaproteobacteria bacterium]
MPARQLRQPRAHAPLEPALQEPEQAAQAPTQDEDLSPDTALAAQEGLGNAGVAALLPEPPALGGEEDGAAALGGFAWWEEDNGGDDAPSEHDTQSSPLAEALPAPASSAVSPEPNQVEAAPPALHTELCEPLNLAATALPHQRIPALNAALPQAEAALRIQHEAAAASLPELETPTGLAPQEAPDKPAPLAPIPAQALTLAGPSSPGPDTDTRSVQLSGEADPERMRATQAQADAALAQASAQAMGQAAQDRGEHSISPTADPERLSAPLHTNPAALSQSPLPETGALPPELLVDLDLQAAPLLDSRLAAPLAQAQQAQLDAEAGAQAAQLRADTDIAGAEQAAILSQEGAKERALSEVGAARADWASEIQAVQAEAQDQAQSEQAAQTQAIRAEAQGANAEAAAHLEAAEQEAAALSAEAAQQVAAEQGQAEEGGLLDLAADAARAVVDGLKAVVNAIYEGLRAAVAAVFEAAEALASGVIELAQRAIVALIELYAEALKGILSVALAAFPELAEALTQRIDAAVAQASALVQAAADLLKQGVAAALGLLADTLDQLLALSQSFYNAAFSLLGLALNGEWRALLEGLEGLVDAGAQAPPQFEAAAFEELLGGDLSQPLSPGELELAGLAAPSAGPMNTGLGPPWSTDNVGVDAVLPEMTLSPKLSAELLAETGGDGVVEFGWSEDPTRSLDHILGLDAQNQDAAPFDDGLSVRERAAAKWSILKDGLESWWSANWPTVLGAGVLGVGGFIAANLLTGGAVLAALPPLMAILGPLFMGMMVAQVGGYVSDYLTRGWAGDAQGGGKALARALAVGAIELASAATFKVGGAVLKGARSLARGAAKGARALGRGAAKGAAGLAGEGSDYVLRQGKVLLGGVDDARLGQRARNLDELGEGLANKTRFKGYRIQLHGRRFELEGKINPWILLANGKVEWQEDEALKRLKPGSGKLRMGEQVLTQGDEAMEGVVVGLDRADKGALAESLEQLSGATARRAEHAAALGVDGDDILPMYKHLTQADMPEKTITERAATLGLSEDDMRRAIREQGEGTLTRMGQRSDEEMLYALKAGQHEVADGGHSLLRHGPDVTDEALKRRLTEGVAPDLKPVENAPPGSTQFHSYQEWLETRQKAIEAIEAGQSSANWPIDLRHAPGNSGNDPNIEHAKTILEHTSSDTSSGRGYIGKPMTLNGQKRVSDTRPDGTSHKIWPGTNSVDEGVNRVVTTVAWDASNTRWHVVQHFPLAGETSFDLSTNTYKPNAPPPHASR